MHDPDNEHDVQADFEKVKSDVKDSIERGQQTATDALHDAKEAIKQKAAGYVSEATDALSKRADTVQRDISSSLSDLAGAMRAASEHLANSSQRDASKFVLDAAGGVERLSSSLKTKPFTEVVGELRSFGRENSAALIAGSVLAGLAMGRFLKSSTPDIGPTASVGEDSSGSASFVNPRFDTEVMQVGIREPDNE